MTTTPPEPIDRLDRIERILQGVTENLALLTQENRETRQIAESNARAIEALTNHTAEARDAAEEERSELSVGLNALRESVAQLVQESRENIAQHLAFRGEIQDLRDQINDPST
jgi:ABC-type transporter Mla subunit MlaD